MTPMVKMEKDIVIILPFGGSSAATDRSTGPVDVYALVRLMVISYNLYCVRPSMLRMSGAWPLAA